MRFICDVCPSTACEGHAAVIIGNYEQWIRHLLTPQHQTEQNLVMARTSYWPQAEWIAMIKDLPIYDEATTELYVDLMLNLSEYGFIEALYYGSKMKDSLCIALQLYETNACPSYLMYRDGMKYELKVAPRFSMDSINGLNAGKNGRRRQRYNSMASPLSEVAVVPSFIDVATSPILDYEKENDIVDSSVKMLEAEVITNKGKECYEKKIRIKYDMDTLLEFHGKMTMPLRLGDILISHEIILQEPKVIDIEKFRRSDVQWCVDANRNFSSTNKSNNNFKTPFLRNNQNGQRMVSGDGSGRGRGQFQRFPRNQNGRNAERPENSNTRWTMVQEEIKPLEVEQEEWW